MAKTATVKDVLYALEYTKSTLVRTPRTGKKPTWLVLPEQINVTPSVADKSRECRNVVISSQDMDGKSVYKWQD